MKSENRQELLQHMSRDLKYWYGPFYANRKDPRLIVRKYYPALGYTLNFASPYAYLAIAGLIAVILTSAYLF